MTPPFSSPPKTAPDSNIARATIGEPTRVRISFPPEARTTSSTTLDVLTGVTTVPPRPFTAARARSASALSPTTNAPLSSTNVARSASPSCAIPRSAWTSDTTRMRSPRWSGVGSGNRPGKAPSGCAFRDRTRHPRERRRYGVTTHPAPFPGSTTTIGFRLRIASASTFASIASMYRGMAVSSARLEPTSDQAAAWNRSSKRIASIDSSSSRRISIPWASIALRPLNSRGLCEAVTTMAPFRCPDLATKYWAHGVGTMPTSITSHPADIRPEAAARASMGPLRRGSRASPTKPPSKNVPIARPTLTARSAFIASPTTPRMPFVPKRRVMPPPGRRGPPHGEGPARRPPGCCPARGRPRQSRPRPR